MKFRELNDRGSEVKFKKVIEKLFFQRIFVPIDDMDKFEQKEMKKISLIKNTWYDWLINYIPNPKTKNTGGFKDKRQTYLNKLCKGKERNKYDLKKTLLTALEIVLN